jgi:hypothetical protein
MRGAVAVFVILALPGPIIATASADRFTPAGGFQPADLAYHKIFDLGAVDFNGDGNTDLFTTNHDDRSVLLENDGAGGFTDVLSSVHLDQTPAFPGWFVVLQQPPTENVGLYLFPQGGDIHILANQVTPEASGQLTFLVPVKVLQTDGADVSTFGTQVSFTVSGDEDVVLRPQLRGLPVAVHLDAGYPLTAVFVGAYGVSPASGDFTLNLRDRHAMAWGDFSHDGRLDAFIVRGGLRGLITQHRDFVEDELQLGSPSGFTDVGDSSHLHKGRCRGRQAATIDFNGDGRLDLFESCESGSPRLYQQQADGTFRNRSRQLKQLGHLQGSLYRWVDLDGDGLPELLVARGHRFAVFRLSTAGDWSRYMVSGRQSNLVRALSVGDFNDDARPDVFAASPSGNTLLVNQGGTLNPRDPAKLGLPSKTIHAASWVDYNNDGRIDLHVLPDGLYRHMRGRGFEATGLMSSADATRAIWPDLNNDGFRDPVITPSLADSAIQPFLNRPNAKHWLEVDVTGTRPNFEAIGARVMVEAGRLVQTQWVGQSDGSRYSQGDYRLYFGLGDRPGVDSLTVTWPDGHVQQLNSVGADRQITIDYAP